MNLRPLYDRIVVRRIEQKEFWGVNWKAMPQHLTEKFTIEWADLVVGCVDNRSARRAIACKITGRESDVS